METLISKKLIYFPPCKDEEVMRFENQADLMAAIKAGKGPVLPKKKTPLLRADLPSAILEMTTDPDKDTAFSAILSLAFMMGGEDDKNNPHIVADSAAVPLLC
jgi:hypothetical protein